jgi:hypothetical protein
VASPFFDAIKAGVTGTPGTGAITIGAVTSGFRAFSNVPANTLVDYRIEDGTAWEIGSGLWNGTTLTRGLKYSSTGSLLTLSSSAVVSLIISAEEVQPHIGGGHWSLIGAAPGQLMNGTTGYSGAGYGSGAATTPAATNYRTRQHRVQYTSATTANSTAGYKADGYVWGSTAGSGLGGFEFVARYGLAQIVSEMRLFTGVAGTASITTQQPDALANVFGFGKASTDTNIQFITRTGTGTVSKVDTGITPSVNDFYEAAIWQNPGASTVMGMLSRLTDGKTWQGSSSQVPDTVTVMHTHCMGGLTAATGTALIFDVQSMYLRSSF